MPISSINTSFLNKIAAAGSSSNDLASLKTKLATLMKAVKELANDSSMSVDAKKRIQKLLQLQIQQVMQQIAELQKKGEKGEPVAEAPNKQTLSQLASSQSANKLIIKPVALQTASAAASDASTSSSPTTNVDTFA
jgi:hypothetical protein